MFRYRIEGTVREDRSERPLPALLVRAYDRDILKDDPLGDSTTDGEGRFRIQFTELEFRDVMEQRPDIYLRIFDPTGVTELFSTAAAVRHEARALEYFEIRVPAERVAAAGLGA